jgi:hypothetical protein
MQSLKQHTPSRPDVGIYQEIKMGNRAVITFNTTESAPCIYLHWNGGRASVEAFLRVARHLELNASMRGGGINFDLQAHTLDALAEILAKHFFNCEVGFTVYRQTYGSADTDNWDNGVYVMNRNFDIVQRLYMRHAEEVDTAKTAEIYGHILKNIALADAQGI